MEYLVIVFIHMFESHDFPGVWEVVLWYAFRKAGQRRLGMIEE